MSIILYKNLKRKCTIQEYWVYSNLCDQRHNLRTFLSPQKKHCMHCLWLPIYSQPPLTSLWITTKLLFIRIDFRSYAEMDSQNTRPFISSFFDSVCFEGSFLLRSVSGLQLFYCWLICYGLDVIYFICQFISWWPFSALALFGYS